MLHMLFAATLSTAPVLGAPTIFAPGVVSRYTNNGSPTFSPDGKTLFFARSANWSVILESHRQGDGWSTPEIAPFSGTWNDWSPEFSPDGRYLIYVSVRPKLGANLYRVDRTGNGWSQPVRLPDAVNIGRSQWKPSIAGDGSIYFTSVTKAGKRLYCSRYVDGAYRSAQPLSFSDGTHGDVDPEVAPDEAFMVFASNGRTPGDSADHLFIVYRTAGAWGEPQPLRYAGDDANGRSTDNEPHLSPDGHTLYFSSDRTLPVQFPRTREQAQADLEQMQTWNNGNLNAWFLTLTK